MGGVSYDYQVKGEVPFIKQRGPTCWAACGAMMHGWRYQSSYSMKATIDYAGNPYIDYLKRQRSIPLNEIGNFGYAIDLTRDAMRSFSAEQFYTLMSTSGSPLMICILQKGETMHHFNVATRIYTNDLDMAVVVVNDPNDSGGKELFFDDLYELMTRAASGTDNQVLHY